MKIKKKIDINASCNNLDNFFGSEQCNNNCKDRKTCEKIYYRQFDQDKLLKILLRQHIKMQDILHKAMFGYKYLIDEKHFTKMYASNTSIIKEARTEKRMQERNKYAVESFYKAKQLLKDAEKQANKYCALARGFDYIFNTFVDSKTSQKFYNIVDFKEYL